MSDTFPPSLRLMYSEVGEAELEAAYRFRLRYGYQAAEQWLGGLQILLQRECELQAILPVRRAPLIEFPDRNVYVLQYVTRGGSPWRVLCELKDADGDGETDTLFIVGVRHAALGPPDTTSSPPLPG